MPDKYEIISVLKRIFHKAVHNRVFQKPVFGIEFKGIPNHIIKADFSDLKLLESQKMPYTTFSQAHPHFASNLTFRRKIWKVLMFNHKLKAEIWDLWECFLVRYLHLQKLFFYSEQSVTCLPLIPRPPVQTRLSLAIVLVNRKPIISIHWLLQTSDATQTQQVAFTRWLSEKRCKDEVEYNVFHCGGARWNIISQFSPPHNGWAHS